MRCACGHEVARGNDLVAMAAPDSERTFRYVPLGHHGDSVNATVSRLRNPHGYAFDLVTVAEVREDVHALVPLSMHWSMHWFIGPFIRSMHRCVHWSIRSNHSF